MPQTEERNGPKIVIFNLHARRRTDVITIKVSIPNVKVYQIDFVHDNEEGQSIKNEFCPSFPMQAKGRALQTYHVGR